MMIPPLPKPDKDLRYGAIAMQKYGEKCAAAAKADAQQDLDAVHKHISRLLAAMVSSCGGKAILTPADVIAIEGQTLTMVEDFETDNIVFTLHKEK
jgi:hypothetical protein